MFYWFGRREILFGNGRLRKNLVCILESCYLVGREGEEEGYEGKEKYYELKCGGKKV